MQPDAIYARLTEIFRDVFDDEEIVLRPDTTAKDIPEWDSLSHVRLVLTVQHKFSADQTSNLKIVGEFVSLIATRVV